MTNWLRRTVTLLGRLGQKLRRRAWRLRGQALLLLLSLPVSALAVLTRGYPTTGGDAGVFLSVAGRLLAGDRLYRDVYDNKDPLFYFSQTLALWAAGWRGPFLLDIAWLFFASVAAHLLLWTLTGDRVVAVFGQVLYPLLLTGIDYRSPPGWGVGYPHVGYSETPGMCLLPWFAYLVYRRRWAAAGFTGAIILFLKVTLLIVVVAIAVAGLVFAHERPRRSARVLVEFIGTGAIAVWLIFLVLISRGEAAAYIETLRDNASYAPRALRIVYGLEGVRGHLIVVRDKIPRLARDVIVADVAFIGGAIVAGADARRRLFRSPLMMLTFAASFGTLVMLSVTALWSNHLEALAFPMFCGLSLALACTRTSVRGSPRVLGAVAVGVVALCSLAASLLLNLPGLGNLRAWTAPPTTVVSDALQDAAARTTKMHSRLTYFHLGADDEDGQGAFLGSSFRLACPHFQQYPFTSPALLQGTIRCMERTRPRLIAVTPSFADWYGPERDPEWIQFVRTGRSYVRSRCQLAVARAEVRVYTCGAAGSGLGGNVPPGDGDLAARR